MKKIFFLLVCLPLFAWAQERIMVISDPHVLPQALIEADANFDTYMQTQRKMLDLSEPIWNALMDTALLHHPDLVLIPGDLTRGGEAESHEMVAASLRSLQEAGIPSLVIPGNHDILSDDAWESTYAELNASIVARDAGSHSFAAEPFDGLTILGIDASHGKASVGSISEQTLQWILAQADEALSEGHMIIAMCHWQILEHVDRLSQAVTSARLENADAIRDSLMHHGVHAVLTGHMHVNGITTYIDPGTQDSLVEITTGSPITYPCPYRWLSVSENRTKLAVETQNITSVEGIADLHTYSRAWMAEHTHNLIPSLTLSAWRAIEARKDLVAEQFGEKVVERLVNNCIPATDSAKIAIVDQYLGSTVVDLYLLHSDANEPEYPQADSLAQAFYAGLDGLVDELLSADPVVKPVVLVPMTLAAEALAQEPIQSLVEDVTQWHSDHPNRTDDLHLQLTIGDGYQGDGIEQTPGYQAPTKYLQDGQVLIETSHSIYTITGTELK